MRPDYQAGNRAAMPTIAAFVDEIRAQGISVKVLFASECGTRFDRREPVSPDQVFEIPARYREPVEIKEKKR